MSETISCETWGLQCGIESLFQFRDAISRPQFGSLCSNLSALRCFEEYYAIPSFKKKKKESPTISAKLRGNFWNVYLGRDILVWEGNFKVYFSPPPNLLLPGGNALHVYPAYCQPLPDLHSHVSHQLPAASKGEPDLMGRGSLSS